MLVRQLTGLSMLFGFGKKKEDSQAIVSQQPILSPKPPAANDGSPYFLLLYDLAVMAASTADTRELFRRLAEEIRHKLSYDRFFAIELLANGAKPYISAGFEDRPFESKFDNLYSGGLLYQLSAQPVWLFGSNSNGLGQQINQILGTDSSAIIQLQTPHWRALIGVGRNDSQQPLQQSDSDFLTRLIRLLGPTIEQNARLDLLEQQNIELKQLDKAKTMFLSIASHQLRTPLTVMRFALNMLQNPRVGQLNQQQHTMVAEMSKNNGRLINLVNNLLNITRMQQGRVVIRPQTIQLAPMIRDIITQLQPQIQGKRVVVRANVPEIITFTADPMLIREVIMNLVSNGVKYNRDGGQLLINASNDAERVTVSVQDNGIGIPKDDLPRMFSQFYRSQQATVVDPQGVGLGLYTAREFVRLHGGDITVTSTEGQGTTFTVTMPAQPKVGAGQQNINI